VLDNVALSARVQGRARQEQRALAASRLELVGLDPGRFGALFPRQLSGGQRQRVGVARALASSSDLVLMDEPFGALDPITRRELQDEFRRLQRRLGTTVILVTHDLREACRLGDRLVLLHEGRIVQSGRAIEFVDHPADDYVREFFRDAAAVEIEG
jgi:osmoprotectant transport system ATP-binding protein